MKRSLLLALIAAALSALIFAGAAVGTTYVTGAGIKDETISAEDIGPDVTRVKVVNLTIASEEAVSKTECYPDEEGELQCGAHVDSGATTKTQTIRCPGGNVTGGGIKFTDDADMANLDVESYPSSDNSWTYKLYNDGPEDITVQLRIVCI